MARAITRSDALADASREGGVRAVVLTSEDALRAYVDEWDALAVANSQPTSSPHWMLPWWRHARPSNAALRAVVVLDDDGLVGVAPFFAHRGRTRIVRYRLLGAGCSGEMEPLARPGSEQAVALAVADALSHARPRAGTIFLDGVRATSAWPRLLAEAWPSRRALPLRSELELRAPYLRIEGGYDEWLASKSRNFRQNLRRKRRKLESLGAEFSRVHEPEELADAIPAFARLHRARWSERGGSRVLGPGVDRMLMEAGQVLIPMGRMDLWTITVEGRCISSHLFLRAGGTTTYWLGGFDDAWSGYQPALLSLLAAIEDAFASGLRRVDLGVGAQDYKLRFADDDELVRRVNVITRPAITPLARLEVLPQRLRLLAAERLPPRAKDAAKAVAARIGRRGNQRDRESA